MDLSFTATGHTYPDEINALRMKAPDVPDRIIAGVVRALHGAFDALEVTAHGLDREFRARVAFLGDGSFSLSVIPGGRVAPRSAPAPVDDPQVTAQEIARQRRERARIGA